MARLILVPRLYASSKVMENAEHASLKVMENLNKLKNKPYMAYLKRKHWKWYSKATRPLCKQTADYKE
jgi:hypothetical protein